MKKERVFWGIFFIMAAVFIIISKLGLLGNVNVLSLLLTVFIVACLIKSVMHKEVGGILFSLAFLCIVYAKPLGIEAITPWPVLGAALLGTIGASFLYRPKADWFAYGSHHISGNEAVEIVKDAQIEFNTSFGGSIKYINSDDFQSAKLRCSFGSMKVYFDNAVIENGQATVQMDVSFAGVELYIPRGWKVINNVDASFGGIDEKNRNDAASTPTLNLIGKVSFSGVEIIYI